MKPSTNSEAYLHSSVMDTTGSEGAAEITRSKPGNGNENQSKNQGPTREMLGRPQEGIDESLPGAVALPVTAHEPTSSSSRTLSRAARAKLL